MPEPLGFLTQTISPNHQEGGELGTHGSKERSQGHPRLFWEWE